MAVKQPHRLSESAKRPFKRSSDGTRELLGVEALGGRTLENVASPRCTSYGATRSSMGKISELPERENKVKKYSLRSLKRYITYSYLYPTVPVEFIHINFMKF